MSNGPDQGKTGLEEAHPAAKGKSSRAGAALGWGAVIAAAALGFVLLLNARTHPRSDDAVVSAPVTGIAPRVSGPVKAFFVSENELVPAGAPMFEIDPEPYELAVRAARAAVEIAEGELENARRLSEGQEREVAAAAAALAQAGAAEAEAAETYQRLLPLLDKRYASAEEVGAARRASEIAAAGVAAATARLEAAQAVVRGVASSEAAVRAARVELEEAELALSHCVVRAPFEGRIAGMNLPPGTFARAGIDLFTMIDTGGWHVTARFRESELHALGPGKPAKVELMTAPGRTWNAEVTNSGFGVTALPQDPFPGLPIVMKELDWVRLSQRFPVRLRFTEPVPAEFLRVGATAAVTVLP